MSMIGWTAVALAALIGLAGAGIAMYVLWHLILIGKAIAAFYVEDRNL